MNWNWIVTQGASHAGISTIVSLMFQQWLVSTLHAPVISIVIFEYALFISIVIVICVAMYIVGGLPVWENKIWSNGYQTRKSTLPLLLALPLQLEAWIYFGLSSPKGILTDYTTLAYRDKVEWSCCRKPAGITDMHVTTHYFFTPHWKDIFKNTSKDLANYSMSNKILESIWIRLQFS
jgi:hypothetical protein